MLFFKILLRIFWFSLNYSITAIADVGHASFASFALIISPSLNVPVDKSFCVFPPITVYFPDGSAVKCVGSEP